MIRVKSVECSTFFAYYCGACYEFIEVWLSSYPSVHDSVATVVTQEKTENW